MSAVRDYYRSHPSWNDDLHKLLNREPGLLAQLPGLRARALACCGAEPSKNGEIRLVVADPVGWDAIAKEQAATQLRLDAISTAVDKIDAIFAEMEAAAVKPHKLTIRAIWAEEADRRTEVIDPYTGTRYDPKGHPVPQKRDPQFVAWGERAEAALREAQAIVG